ncbi:sugar transferase [Oceanicola sp. S124]|uniref:sugar transferase n=1 Tax=Oceanicola sp. S124 TaxID=1042378 RepID=UPI00025599BD|nr:sugar transferase [Oceanicola sp. S124]
MKAFDISSTENSFTPASIEPEAGKERRSPPASLYARGGKRLLDLILVSLLLPLFLPLIALLWILTRLDGGPGFYGQKRVGLDGRTFNCWKIRTMVMNAEKVLQDLCDSDPEIAREWHENQKLAVDPRITPIGGFLRATSLDELPQIWNVIRGEMSFVGPRPFMTSQEPLYRAAGGTAYYDLRPGITGSWQVDGRGVTTFVERVAYDEDYLASLSLREDLRLVWQTVVVLLKRTGH